MCAESPTAWDRSWQIQAKAATSEWHPWLRTGLLLRGAALGLGFGWWVSSKIAAQFFR
jgi:hypothetical protein